jgi:hypothetical protein
MGPRPPRPNSPGPPATDSCRWGGNSRVLNDKFASLGRELSGLLQPLNPTFRTTSPLGESISQSTGIGRARCLCTSPHLAVCPLDATTPYRTAQGGSDFTRCARSSTQFALAPRPAGTTAAGENRNSITERVHRAQPLAARLTPGGVRSRIFSAASGVSILRAARAHFRIANSSPSSIG